MCIFSARHEVEPEHEGYIVPDSDVPHLVAEQDRADFFDGQQDDSNGYQGNRPYTEAVLPACSHGVTTPS